MPPDPTIVTRRCCERCETSIAALSPRPIIRVVANGRLCSADGAIVGDGEARDGSTNDHVRPCNLKPQPRDLTPVLHRPVEPAGAKRTSPTLITSAFAPWSTIQQDNGTLSK